MKHMHKRQSFRPEAHEKPQRFAKISLPSSLKTLTILTKSATGKHLALQPKPRSNSTPQDKNDIPPMYV